MAQLASEAQAACLGGMYEVAEMEARAALKLQPGQIAHVVLAETSTNEPSRMVGAGIGLAVPAVGDHLP